MNKLTLIAAAATLISGSALANPAATTDPHGENPHGNTAQMDAVWVGDIDPHRMIMELIPMGRGYLEYQVDEAALAALKNYDQETEITVIVGTWCGTCHEQTPKLIKILNTLDNPKIKARYIGVDREGGSGDVSLEGINFSSIPTVIISRDGEEIGRFSGKPAMSVEENLTFILTM